MDTTYIRSEWFLLIVIQIAPGEVQYSAERAVFSDLPLQIECAVCARYPVGIRHRRS